MYCAYIEFTRSRNKKKKGANDYFNDPRRSALPFGFQQRFDFATLPSLQVLSLKRVFREVKITITEEDDEGGFVASSVL